MNRKRASHAWIGGAGFILPPVVLEIEPDFVVGALLSRASPAGVRRMAIETLDSGVLEPSPTQANVIKPELLARSLRAITRTMRNGGGRLGLLLPDAAVRVNIVSFETLPPKRGELEALLNWKIKESLGFPPEEAKLSWQITHAEAGLVEVLVVAAKRDVLRQYETALKTLRYAPVLILPVTLALLALLPGDLSDVLLFSHVCSGWVTHAVVEGNRLRLWRNRRLSSPAGDSGASEVLSEAARAVASVRDRLGLEVKKAWRCARPGAGDGPIEEMSRLLGLPVENISLGASFDASLASEEKPLFAPFGAPLAGLIANSGSAS